MTLLLIKACAFNEKKDQDLFCLQNSSFCGLEMMACRGSDGGVWRGDPVPLYLSFTFIPCLFLSSPHFFLFTELCWFVTWSQRQRKQSVLKSWCSFFEIWCQKAFGKIPNSSKYRKSDQILCERLLPFWSLQKRRKLYSYSTFLAEVRCQENHPYGNICIQK